MLRYSFTVKFSGTLMYLVKYFDYGESISWKCIHLIQLNPMWRRKTQVLQQTSGSHGVKRFILFPPFAS